MPDYIETSRRRHILVTSFARGLAGRGRTLCGRTVNGQTGGSMPALINCLQCRRKALLDKDPALDVVCPQCGADRDKPCMFRTRTGWRRALAPHWRRRVLASDG